MTNFNRDCCQVVLWPRGSQPTLRAKIFHSSDDNGLAQYYRYNDFTLYFHSILADENFS